MVLHCSCRLPVRKITWINYNFLQRKTLIWLMGLQNRNFKPLKNLQIWGEGQGLILVLHLRKWNFMASWSTWNCWSDSLWDQSLLWDWTKTVQSFPSSPEFLLSFHNSILERTYLENRSFYAQFLQCIGTFAEHVNKCHVGVTLILLKSLWPFC